MEHVARNILVLAANRRTYYGRDEVAVALISAIRVVKPELFRRIERGEAQETDEEVLKMKVRCPKAAGTPLAPGL